jgi:hypothetical protein
MNIENEYIKLSSSMQPAILTTQVTIVLFLATQIINWLGAYLNARRQKRYVSKLIFLSLYNGLKKTYFLRESILQGRYLSRESIGTTGFLVDYHGRQFVNANLDKLINVLSINSFEEVVRSFDIAYRLDGLLEQFFSSVERSRVKQSYLDKQVEPTSEREETEQLKILKLQEKEILNDEDRCKWAAAYSKLESFFYCFMGADCVPPHKQVFTKQALKQLFKEASFSREELQIDFDNILDELDELYKLKAKD